MAFEFKMNNPGVKFGFYILLPVCLILLGYSIFAQSCSGSSKTPVAQEQVVDVPDASAPAEVEVVAPDATVEVQ